MIAHPVPPAAPPAAPHLAFEGLGKSFFGVPVLRDVSFELGRGKVLGLVGENGAGKSTLMNILGGNLRPDSGRMAIDGEAYEPRTPADAARRGIGFIHQELNLFGNLTVAENLFLADFPCRLGLIRRKALRARAAEALARVGFGGDPGVLVERLPAGERQLVEIAKAIRADARLLILDEPTTSLTARETEALFSLLAALRGRGMTMVYISHTLEDVLRLADGVVVLRDGEVAGSGPAAGFTVDRLVSLMVGRSLDRLYPERKGRPADEVVLEARGVSRVGAVRDITFSLRRGEVLGIAGLLGSGRTELARILFGADPLDRGQVLACGRPVRPGPRRSIRLGLGFQTESRREDGLCIEASVGENIALASLPRFRRGPLGLLDLSALRAAAGESRDAVRLDARAGIDRAVKTLSGGNQQKVVLAKWLLAGPRVLILDEPTRGIDVGAKAEIYGLIADLADRGTGILLVSSEIEELLGLCDRILVMASGEVRDVLDRPDFDRERILRAALGGRAGR
jgi:ribose transport system ATP-binding protein